MLPVRGDGNREGRSLIRLLPRKEPRRAERSPAPRPLPVPRGDRLLHGPGAAGGGKTLPGAWKLHFPSALAAAESRRCLQHRACNIQPCHLRSDGLRGFAGNKTWIRSAGCNRAQAPAFCCLLFSASSPLLSCKMVLLVGWNSPRKTRLPRAPRVPQPAPEHGAGLWRWLGG